MGKYLYRRLFLLIPTLIGVTLVSFLMLRAIPGDPAIVMLGEQSTAQDLVRIRQSLGLEKPLAIQYLLYIWRCLNGDWGQSIFAGTPVLPLVLRRLQATLILAVATILFTVIIGICSGAIAAARRGSRLDSALRSCFMLCFSVPTFLVGLLLILIFSLYLHWFPSMGIGSIRHLVLPILTLTLWSSGTISRMTRASMLDVLDQDYIRTAKAKGVSEPWVLAKHVLRNALIPVITVSGLQFGSLLGGAVITETVFNYPGLGKLIVDHIFMRDYPVVQGAILAGALGFTLTNFLVDFLYIVVDPRIRSQALQQ